MCLKVNELLVGTANLCCVMYLLNEPLALFLVVYLFIVVSKLSFCWLLLAKKRWQLKLIWFSNVLVERLELMF